MSKLSWDYCGVVAGALPAEFFFAPFRDVLESSFWCDDDGEHALGNDQELSLALIAARPTEGSDRSNDSRAGTSLTTQLKISGQENVITVFMIPRGGRTLCPAALKSISL
jgi:hypothetical protein